MLVVVVADLDCYCRHASGQASGGVLPVPLVSAQGFLEGQEQLCGGEVWEKKAPTSFVFYNSSGCPRGSFRLEDRMPQQALSPKRSGLLSEAQQQAEAAAATLIERKFKEPANLEVFYFALL